MVINEDYVKNKINEYLILLSECNYVNDQVQIQNISKKLNKLKIVINSNMDADALVSIDTIKLNPVLINKYINIYGPCISDEALFHEFTHIANSIHYLAFNKENPPYNQIIDNMYLKTDNDTLNKLKRKIYNIYNIFIAENREPLLYNQNPGNGMVLLDEVISQVVAQNLVKYKASKIDNYVKNNYLQLYEPRTIEMLDSFCSPQISVNTQMAVYEIFYPLALAFLEKYHINLDDFIKKSLNDNNFQDILANMSTKELKTLYNDLCILGIPFIREYYLAGHTYITNKYDPSLDKNQVHDAIIRTLKK